jgi:hypothetical protein
MKNFFFIISTLLLAGCAAVFETPFTVDKPGYSEAARLNSAALWAKFQAQKTGRHFDCSDYAEAAAADCPDCQLVTVEMLSPELLPTGELHQFAVTRDGWAIDIQYPVPYEHDHSTYLLRRYAEYKAESL